MKESQTVGKYRTALIIVSTLLIAVLLAQGIYWARGREAAGQQEQAAQTEAESAESEPAEAAEPAAQEEEPAQAEADGQQKEPAQASKEETARGSLSHEGYTLEQVVVMSRHNIRSPLSGKGSVLGRITPHQWFEWSSNPSELSLRGGAAETIMGQYFRKWMESEGLFPENYHPEEDAVRFYSNSKQRTIATAEYFKAGLLPTANEEQVEYKVEFDAMDPVFNPQITFLTDEYEEDVKAQIEETYVDEFGEIADSFELLADVIDLEDSEAYQSGEVTGFSTDDMEIVLDLNKEPGMTGSFKTACSVSDALVLQYYEEADEKAAAFGHELTKEQWGKISEAKDLYGDVLFATPLLAYNVEHPILQEIRKELTTEGREFTFLCGHDSNINGILSCLRASKYSLPGAIEAKTPIGVKIVFSRWRAPDGRDVMSVDLVYASAEQLRGLSLMDLENPPCAVPMILEGLAQNEDGLYDAEDVIGRLDEAIGEYDKLLEKYGAEENSEESEAESESESESESVEGSEEETDAPEEQEETELDEAA